ncbi:transmembrane protein 69 [Spea bombifrons]|uniref:transmembrane protein 69 n=1 Tax=Spea bombifrons TaxID=233779 RepID=UPI002349B838|nr:transmembrane protein 69 [Spea bombifrons]
MLARFGWRGIPLAVQVCEKTSPLSYASKQRLFPGVSSGLNIKRCIFTPHEAALRLTFPNLIHKVEIHTSNSHLKKRKVQEEPEPRELDLLRYDMRSLKDAPKPALYLGLGGLIPFVAAPLVMNATACYYPEVAFAQVAYGASILSFLGGVRWGFAIPEGSPAKPDWKNLANSTVPALLAWLALLFREDLSESTFFVIMGLGIALHYDLSLLPTYPPWFKALRAILTLVAILSLVGTLAFSSVYPHKSLNMKTT